MENTDGEFFVTLNRERFFNARTPVLNSRKEPIKDSIIFIVVRNEPVIIGVQNWGNQKSQIVSYHSGAHSYIFDVAEGWEISKVPVLGPSNIRAYDKETNKFKDAPIDQILGYAYPCVTGDISIMEYNQNELSITKALGDVYIFIQNIKSEKISVYKRLKGSLVATKLDSTITISSN